MLIILHKKQKWTEHDAKAKKNSGSGLVIGIFSSLHLQRSLHRPTYGNSLTDGHRDTWVHGYMDSLIDG